MLTNSRLDFDDGDGPKRARVPIRNADGSWSPFSVDRLARDLALAGEPLDEARETARLLLAEAQASGVTALETDDIRHWLAERDPQVFARRRAPVGRLDSELTRLATLALGLAGDDGLALHQMYLAHFMPGMLLADDTDDSPDEREREREQGQGQGQGQEEEKKQPKWIDGETPDPADLDGSFGREADGAKLLDPDKFDEWPPQEGQPDTEEPEWGKPDFTKRGTRGRYSSRYGEDFKDRRAGTIHLGDGTFTAFGPGGGCPVECGENWLLQVDYFQRRQDCRRVDYAAAVRAGLLQAINEAYRRCQSTKCELVRFRIMYQSWSCVPDNKPKPVVWVTTQLAVQCWAL